MRNVNFKQMKKISNQDELSAEQTVGYFFDANNLSGGIIEKFLLPVKSFVLKTGVEIELHENLSTWYGSSRGYILEVDPHYPEYLLDLHSDFALARVSTEENCGIVRNKNSFYKMKTKSRLKHFTTKTKRIASSYYGIFLWTLSRSLKKSESVILWHIKMGKPCILLSTVKRRNITNMFEKNFHRILSILVFGKTMESKRQRMVVELDQTRSKLLAQTKKLLMVSSEIFNKASAAISQTAQHLLE